MKFARKRSGLFKKGSDFSAHTYSGDRLSYQLESLYREWKNNE